jgi:hypothetical protein
MACSRRRVGGVGRRGSGARGFAELEALVVELRAAVADRDGVIAESRSQLAANLRKADLLPLFLPIESASITVAMPEDVHAKVSDGERPRGRIETTIR